MRDSEIKSVDSVNLYTVGQSRIIELNRPASLNTLNLEIVQAMAQAIRVFCYVNIPFLSFALDLDLGAKRCLSCHHHNWLP